MAFLVATTSLPAVYRPNGYALPTTAGTPHARANYVDYKNDNDNDVDEEEDYIMYHSVCHISHHIK